MTPLLLTALFAVPLNPAPPPPAVWGVPFVLPVPAPGGTIPVSPPPPPPLSDLSLFPDAHCAEAALVDGLERLAWIEAQGILEPRRRADWLDLHMQERRRLRCWLALREAQIGDDDAWRESACQQYRQMYCEWWDERYWPAEEVRRSRLAELQRLLGRLDYHSGRMPSDPLTGP